MAISTMYAAMPGSPETTLAADITADATSMTVADGNALPAAPNIAVIGDESNAEVVIYNAKSGNTLSGLIRGSGGTTASTWTTGTPVARNYTSFDHNRFVDNINDLETNKANIDNVYSKTEMDAALAEKAPLESPDLTGTPTAPTAASGTNTTQIASTAFVRGELNKEILYFYQQAVSAATSAQIMRIPASGTNDAITDNTVVLECTFAVPSRITSDVTWTSYAGYIVFTGTCTAATTANVTLGQKGN